VTQALVVEYLPVALVIVGVVGLVYLLRPPKRVAAFLERNKPAPAPTPERAASLPTSDTTQTNLPLERVDCDRDTARLVEQAAQLVPGLYYLWSPRLADIIGVGANRASTQSAIQTTNRLRSLRVALAVIDQSTLKPAAAILIKHPDNAVVRQLLQRARLPFAEVDPTSPTAMREAFEGFGWDLPDNTIPEHTASADPVAATQDDVAFIREKDDGLDAEAPLDPIDLSDEQSPHLPVDPSPPIRPSQPDMFPEAGNNGDGGKGRRVVGRLPGVRRPKSS